MTVKELIEILNAVNDKNKIVFVADRAELNDNTSDFEVIEIGVSSYNKVAPGVFIVVD